MKKPLATLRFISFFIVSLLFTGCSDAPPDDVYKLLEEKAKVKTFPLTIVLTNPLTGDAFPDDLKTLCKYSAAVCKTLPTAGLLRLGPDQYFTFNAFASLNAAGAEGDDEATIAQSVQNQVTAWFLKIKLKDYDSLRAATKPEYNLPALTAQYVQNSKDSIYFYSANPLDPSLVFAGSRSLPVYKDASILRRVIDEQICKTSVSISIFYAPSNLPAGAVPSGMYAGDTCVEGSKFEKLNDGKGNLFVGKLLEKNSRGCGFSFPTGIAGDTCINLSRYQKLHDGRGGFKTGNLLEKNSQSCGFVPPRAQTETGIKVPATGSQALPSNPSRSGNTAPVLTTQPVKPAQPAKTSTGAAVSTGTPVRVNSGAAAPATQPVRINAPSTPQANTKTQPVRVNAATTSATRSMGQNSGTSAEPVEKASPTSLPTSTDKRCAKTSDSMCEQDERGNYTGRRIQYCYNSAGKIVRTIVLAKCDGDCRCLGD